MIEVNGKSYSEEMLLHQAVLHLAEWCLAIEQRGTSWDDWDECYKDSCYTSRNLPISFLVIEKMNEIKAKEKANV